MCGLALVIACLGGLPRLALGQSAPPPTIHGTVTMQAGAVVLADVHVALIEPTSGRQIQAATTDAQGQYRFTGVPPGTYRLRAAREMFAEAVRENVIVAAAGDVEISFDLTPLVTAKVEAVSHSTDMPATATSQTTIAGEMIDIAVAGDNFQALLPTVPGVVRGPDGQISMKGGRPAQTGLQVSQTYVNDPTTGGSLGFNLPADAVSAIDVLPNPYAAEYGRFSSGVTRIETRSGGDTWKASAWTPVPIPCLKVCDGYTWGIRNWDPRVSVSGPLIAKRLFLSQSVEGHYHKDPIPSATGGNDHATMWALASFTRLDLAAGAHHAITGSFAAFPADTYHVGLNALTPPEATPDVRQRGYQEAATDTWTPRQGLQVESTFSVKQYDVAIASRGAGAMTIDPTGPSGNFFNDQTRRSGMVQWVETLTRVWRGAGDHVSKTGIDLLHVSFDGTSRSQPVDIVRADGTLGEQWVFGGPTAQRVNGTDIGAFGQDLWRLSDRLIVESGLRVDRDGVLGGARLSPRLGLVVGLLPQGRGVVRGGAGLFTDRTPLLVGAFESIEAPTVTRFAADGVTPLAPPVTLAHRIAAPLQPPSGVVWNIEYDHRLADNLLLRVNHLERTGRHEFVVEPIESAGLMELSSTGRSHYRETELTVRYFRDFEHQLTVSYVHSRSEGDLNAFDALFGNQRAPIVRDGAYGITSVDVPNRVVALSVFKVASWRFAPLVEVRDGFPYSVLNEAQEFVGARNRQRFPFFWTLDLSVSKLMTVAGRHVRIGLRATHALDNFVPRDVQANLASPAFGTFYNSILRRVNLIFELQK